MADLFKLGDLSPGNDTVNPGGGHGNQANNPNTGDLRRKYNFGDRVSELSVAQDPFFRFLSKVSKKPTDDPTFKYTERRPSWHKRYAYVNAAGGTSQSDDTIVANCNAFDAAGDPWYAKMGCDYSNEGNLQNVLGQSVRYEVKDANTDPKFFLAGQIVKFPVKDSDGNYADFISARVESVGAKSTSNLVELTLKTVKGCDDGLTLMGTPASIEAGAGKDTESEESLAQYKCYVVGSAFEEGSGYPDTWKDQPWSTQYGQTQIWKTAMAMTNTARATVLKYSANEWARVWKEHLIGHKWDIEQSLLFGKQVSDNDINYTQGAVDYILNYGNVFGLDINTKTADDFLDDLSGYMDPRYASQSPSVYFCSTAIYNWLHKLGGYFKNNLEVSPQFRADIAMTGKKKVFGVDISTFSTPYGDINVARNIHLDGTDIKMLGIGMKNCAWRPLVGNGVNRDTSVYVGVQTLENSGIDRRVDLILTEGGMEWSLPESHAVWK
jgi:hypothetical protein